MDEKQLIANTGKDQSKKEQVMFLIDDKTKFEGVEKMSAPHLGYVHFHGPSDKIDVLKTSIEALGFSAMVTSE